MLTCKDDLITKPSCSQSRKVAHISSSFKKTQAQSSVLYGIMKELRRKKNYRAHSRPVSVVTEGFPEKKRRICLSVIDNDS